MALLSALVLLALLPAGQGRAADAGDMQGLPPALSTNTGDSGYYYPEITGREIYTTRVNPLKNTGRATRLAFVTALTHLLMSKPYPSPLAVLTEGGDDDRLVVMSLGDHGFRTLYQARGVLALLAGAARSLGPLRDMQIEEGYNFFDIAALLGFQRVTISDGETFTHRVDLR